MSREGRPSAKDIGLTPRETRVISDAGLIKKGARYVEGGRLEVTAQQVQKSKEEMKLASDIKEAREIVEELRQRSKEGKLRRDDYFSILRLQTLIGDRDAKSGWETYRINPKQIGLSTYEDIEQWRWEAAQASPRKIDKAS